MLRYIKDTMLHYIKLTPRIRRQSGGLRALPSGGGGGSSPPPPAGATYAHKLRYTSA